MTRSGKKRKNLAPVKSSGKKKNKMVNKSSPGMPSQGARRQQEGNSAPQSPTLTTPDLAVLLTTGLANIQSSMTGMESRLTTKINSLEETVAQNKQSVVVLTDAVNKNAVDLARLESQFAASEQALESRVTDIVRHCVGQNSSDCTTFSDTGSTVPHIGRSSEQVTRYWKCRRSLRLWPVSGADLRVSVRHFLQELLGYEDEEIDRDISQFSVRRVIEPRSKIVDEVVVEFAAPPIRDSVKSRGFKLEGKAAGIRIEVPHFLRSDFQVLQNLSYKMKVGNRSMKRSIKFDDEAMGVILDVQLPGEEWRRIRPEQARLAGRTDPSLRSGPLEMSVDMIAGAVRRGQELAVEDPLGSSAASGANATPLGDRAE